MANGQRRRWAGEPEPASSAGAFERGLQRACGIGLAGFVVQAVAVVVAGWSLYPTWFLVGPGPVLVGAAAWAAVAALRGRSRPTQRLVVVAVCALGCVATAIATADTVVAMGDVAQPLVTGLVGLLGLLDRPGRALPWGLLLVACQVGPVAVTRQVDPAQVALIGTIQTAFLLGSTAGGVLARRGAAAQDAAEARLAEALRRDRVAAASRSDRREQERELHDTVLSTLTAVSRGSLVDTPQLRSRCAADAAYLRALGDRPGRPAPSRSLDEQLRDLAVAQDPGFAVVVHGTGPPPGAVPDRVVSALARATREAVTNAARHSGAGHVEVRVDSTGPEVVVEIVDRGRADWSADGWGLGIPRSITARMADVGGSGTIEHTTGAGTRVVLRWPR